MFRETLGKAVIKPPRHIELFLLSEMLTLHIQRITATKYVILILWTSGHIGVFALKMDLNLIFFFCYTVVIPYFGHYTKLASHGCC